MVVSNYLVFRLHMINKLTALVLVLYVMLCLPLIGAQAIAEEHNSNANLLFKQAITLHSHALRGEGKERITLYRQVLKILNQIVIEYPESVPADRITSSEKVGPIDLGMLRTATMHLDLDLSDDSGAITPEVTPQPVVTAWYEYIVPGGKTGNGFIHGEFPSLGQRTHAGVDIGGGCGLDVFAAEKGVVTRIVKQGDRDFKAVGNAVVIDHRTASQSNTWTVYFHLSEPPEVSRGPVVKGQLLGTTGETGSTEGCHLHFEVRHFDGIRGLFHPEWKNIYGLGDWRTDPIFLTGWSEPREWVEELYATEINSLNPNNNIHNATISYEPETAVSNSIQPSIFTDDPSALQSKLNELGFDAGEVDGYPGPQTRNALMKLQVANCLQPTGQPDKQTSYILASNQNNGFPCSTAKIPNGLSANTPLIDGIYVSKPTYCSGYVLTDQGIDDIRIIGGRGISFGVHGNCTTRRTDIRDGVTLFRGMCFIGPDEVEADWRFDVKSPTEFLEIAGLWENTAGITFTKCADDSTLRQEWDAWFQ